MSLRFDFIPSNLCSSVKKIEYSKNGKYLLIEDVKKILLEVQTEYDHSTKRYDSGASYDAINIILEKLDLEG